MDRVDRDDVDAAGIEASFANERISVPFAMAMGLDGAA
jgi:hypothetical protein